MPVERRAFPQLTLRASQQTGTTVSHRPSAHASDFQANGHDVGIAPYFHTVPLKPEARAEGVRSGCRWSDAHSLSSRFGLPSKRARRSATAAQLTLRASQQTGTTVSHRRYKGRTSPPAIRCEDGLSGPPAAGQRAVDRRRTGGITAHEQAGAELRRCRPQPPRRRRLVRQGVRLSLIHI